jgi:S1-C subfamily serine protease
MKTIKLPLAVLAVSACVAVLVGFASGRATSSATAVNATGAQLQNAFVSVFRKVSPSVVQIQTSEGLGSGIVFDSKGDIVTNAHVVGTAKTFTVTTYAPTKRLTGTLVGTFPADDLAVIKVSGGSLHPASFADSSKLRVGDLAMAIGNPLGLSSSVTQGIISALGRQEPEGNGVVLQNAIQTSAAINPGNSGGALVNIKGEVIGIPTLAAADPQMGGAAAGIGFAIPSNTVKSIAGQIVEHGHVVNSGRPYLGITIGDTGDGVYVGSVSAGSPAAKAGLKAGDVIVALDGKPTTTSDDLGTVLAEHKPGQTVTLKVQRQSGTTAQVKVTLGEYPGTS